MKRHTLDQWMNRLSLLFLLGTAAFLAVCWQRIPEEVPMHFNFAQIYFRDETGTWWKALMGFYRGHLDAHLTELPIPDTPDRSDCDPIPWGEA